MPLIVPHVPATAAGRRRLGVSVALALFTLASLLAWRFSVWGGAALLVAAASWSILFFGWSATQKPLIATWQRLTWPMMWLVGHMLLIVVYFGVLTPLGVGRRWRGGGVDLVFRPGRSNWEKAPEPTVEGYFQQY